MTTSDAPTPPVEDPWARPLFLPGGGDALVFLVAFGADVARLELSAEHHRVDELFPGLDVAVHDAEMIATLLEGPVGDLLENDQPDLVEAMRRTDSCLVIRAEVDDPHDLAYLRTCIGIATAAIDAGAIAVHNLQSLALFDASTWRDDVFTPDIVDPQAFVSILSSSADDDRPDGSVWLHTRGLRVFGRPDLSVVDVPADEVDMANRLCQVLIDQQIKGLVIADGSTMSIGPSYDPIRFRRRGHLDDPDYNNVHVEIVWPARAGPDLASE